MAHGFTAGPSRAINTSGGIDNKERRISLNPSFGTTAEHVRTSSSQNARSRVTEKPNASLFAPQNRIEQKTLQAQLLVRTLRTPPPAPAPASTTALAARPLAGLPGAVKKASHSRTFPVQETGGRSNRRRDAPTTGAPRPMAHGAVQTGGETHGPGGRRCTKNAPRGSSESQGYLLTFTPYQAMPSALQPSFTSASFSALLAV